MAAGFESHYSPARRQCILVIHATLKPSVPDGSTTVTMASDAFTGHDIANTMRVTTLGEADRTVTCRVATARCSSEEEFWKLLAPYAPTLAETRLR